MVSAPPMSITAPPQAAPDHVVVLPAEPNGRPTLYWSDTHLGHARILTHCHRPFASVGAMDAHLVAALVAADASGSRIVHAGDLAWGGWRTQWATLPPLDGADHHLLLLGNHDAALDVPGEAVGAVAVAGRWPLREVDRTRDDPSTWPLLSEPIAPRPPGDWHHWFGRIVGDGHRGEYARYGVLLDDTLDGVTVRVLVTHAPARTLVGGATINVHGHLHDNVDRAPAAHRAAYPWLFGSPAHVNASVERTGYQPRTLQWLVDAQRARGGVP